MTHVLQELEVLNKLLSFSGDLENKDISVQVRVNHSLILGDIHNNLLFINHQVLVNTY